MKLRKIVFLTTQFGPGGAETQILRIALALQRRGYEVGVVSMLPAVGFVDQLHEAGVGYHCLAMTRGKVHPTDFMALVKHLRSTKPDVIANFCFHANVLGSLAGRLARVPVVITSIRGARFGSRNREYIERILSSARITNRTITNSKLVADSLSERGVVARDRVGVIYNGIYSENYRDQTVDRIQLRRDLDVNSDSFLWLAVGNVRYEKDYPTLLRAFAKLKEQQPDAQLRIVGGLWFDDVTTEVNALMDDFQLHENVQFVGQRTNVPELLHAADGFVLSSRTEGLPNAVMEAQASGLPVVATDVGGVRELVYHGVSGFVVPSMEPEALAEAMLEMTKLPREKRKQMGICGQQHIRENFELETVSQQWEDLFRRHLERKKSRGLLSRFF